MLMASERQDQVSRRFRRFRARIDSDQLGMGLVDLMVAISILSLVMTGLALSIGVNFKSVALSRGRQVAESVANKRLEELRDVDYASMALASQPVRSTDPENPDYYVSADGVNYDVTGTGQNEVLIVAPGTGPVVHVESPVTVGTTVVDVYQYVTWVDDPAIAGTQNLKRLSVVVQYHTTPTLGGSKFLRESVVLTNGTVNVGASATTTSTTTTTTTAPPTTTTTAPSSTCGSFGVAGSSGATTGFTASTTVTITMALGACGSPIANFSNDGGVTWGADVSYSLSATTVAWTLPSGNGLKTISGRARIGAGAPWNLASTAIILDTTAPTTPSTLTRTASCSGSTRTVVLTWGASTDTYLVGYHVYRSTDGVSWVLISSTSGLTTSDAHSKTLTSVRFYVKAYDSAGNESGASPTISLAKNQCS